jgi:hypothetical protein
VQRTCSRCCPSACSRKARPKVRTQSQQLNPPKHPLFYGFVALALLVAANLIPRPAYKIPGLVVTKALVNSIHVDHLGYIQPVEIFVYPGSGETIITSSRVSSMHLCCLYG